MRRGLGRDGRGYSFMKRLRGAGAACLILSAILLLGMVAGMALHAGALDGLMAEARTAQEAENALLARWEQAQSAAQQAETAREQAQSAQDTAQDAAARVDANLAALENGEMDDEALVTLNAALQEAQISLASSEKAVDLLASILHSLMGEGGALQNALGSVENATDEMGASLSQVSQAVQAMLLDSLAGPLSGARESLRGAAAAEAEARAAINAAAAALQLPACADFALSISAPAYASAADVAADALHLQEGAQSLAAQTEALAARAGELAEEAKARTEDAGLSPRDAMLLFLAERRFALGGAAAILLILGAIWVVFPAAFLRGWRRSRAVPALCALLLLLVAQMGALGFSAASPGEWWGRWADNALDVLCASAAPGITALGMALVLRAGSVDLAAGATLACAGAVALAVGGGNPLPAAIAGLAVGALAGALMGLAAGKGRAPSWLVPLAAMYILRAVANAIGGGLAHPAPAFAALSGMLLGDRPLLPLACWLLLAVLFAAAMRSRFGRALCSANGPGDLPAEKARVKLTAFVLMGIAAALAAVAQLPYAQDGMGTDSAYVLDALAAAAIGGALSPSDWRGGIPGAMLGALAIGILDNLLGLLGAPLLLAAAAKGAILLVAALVRGAGTQAEERSA